MWFDISQKNCIRCDAWAGALSWWSCQSLVAHSLSLLNHPNSFCGGTFIAKFDADSSLYFFSHFECDATQYTCSLDGVYCPHWLVQWSRHCSHMCIPVHWPWLPGYFDVSQNHSHYINNGWPFLRPCIWPQENQTKAPQTDLSIHPVVSLVKINFILFGFPQYTFIKAPVELSLNSSYMYISTRTVSVTGKGSRFHEAGVGGIWVIEVPATLELGLLCGVSRRPQGAHA